MESRTLLLLILLCAVAIVFLPAEHPTGNVAGTFDVSVTVNGVVYNESAAVQSRQPTTGGGSVNLTLPVHYNGEGVVNITVAKPQDFPAAEAWHIIEDGVTKPAFEQDDNIWWEADFSATDVVLVVTALPPVISTVAENAGQQYEKRVRVSAENHFTDVRAVAEVGPGYTSYLLLENGTDVTGLYGFAVSGTTASWSGFNLSSREFTIVATGMRGGWKKGYVGGASAPQDAPVQEASQFTVSPQFIDRVLAENETAEVGITINSSSPATLTLGSNAPFILVPGETLLVNGTEELTVTLLPYRYGDQEGRIIISDGVITQYVYVTLTVLQPVYVPPEVPVPDAPRPPVAASPMQFPILETPVLVMVNMALAILLMVLIAIGAWRIRR